VRLAFAEIRRNRGRFVAITFALALVSLLVLILAGLSDGLWYGATGAIRNSRADLIVVSGDSLKSIARSNLPLSDVDRVGAVPGVADAGALGMVSGSAQGPRGAITVAVVGFLPGRPGAPPDVQSGRLPAAGERGVAAADTTMRDKGVRLGSTVTVASVPLRVVGFVRDAQYLLQPTLWTPVEVWQDIRARIQPETGGDPGRVQALPVRLAPGASATAVQRRIDAALGDSTTITRDAAVLAIPGAAQMRSTFLQIIVTSFLVAGLVIALFFALVTLEKRDLLATLKALGASNGRLIRGLLAQALLVSGAGLLLGGLAARGITLLLPPSFPAVFRGQTTLTLILVTLLTATAGAALSFRRVARIDPASALGGVL
jgi:putative ABC transport system permease protein